MSMNAKMTMHVKTMKNVRIPLEVFLAPVRPKTTLHVQYETHDYAKPKIKLFSVVSKDDNQISLILLGVLVFFIVLLWIPMGYFLRIEYRIW